MTTDQLERAHGMLLEFYKAITPGERDKLARVITTALAAERARTIEEAAQRVEYWAQKSVEFNVSNAADQWLFKAIAATIRALSQPGPAHTNSERK